MQIFAQNSKIYCVLSLTFHYTIVYIKNKKMFITILLFFSFFVVVKWWYILPKTHLKFESLLLFANSTTKTNSSFIKIYNKFVIQQQLHCFRDLQISQATKSKYFAGFFYFFFISYYFSTSLENKITNIIMIMIIIMCVHFMLRNILILAKSCN